MDNIFSNEFTHVTSWRQKLLAFFKRHVSGREEFHLFVRGALFQKEQNCFESGLLIFHPNFRGSFLEKRFHLNIPICLHILTKNATSELPSLLFFASKLFNLADWRYRFCIVPTFCFHNVSPWILHGNPTHSWYVIGFPSLAFLQMAF